MAVDQPEIPNWSVFDAGGWNGVDFQFNYFAPSAYLGTAPGNHVWQATYSDYNHTSFTSVEAPYAANCMRIQLDDEQNLNDSTIRANVAAWFTAARSNYPDTILSINQIPSAATDANFRDFMVNSQPDMLMIDSYRWTSDPNQGSWNLLSDWQRHRTFALLGNDGTGAHPIPYGFYAQAVDDFPPGQGRVPSESELRFEHFGPWAMGYTMTDDFTYNMNESYSGVESIYFTNGSQQSSPTASYYQIQQVNHDGAKLGPALVRLLSTDVRFVAGQKLDSNNNIVTNPNPISISNWSQGAGNDAYLRGISASNIGTKDNNLRGDVLLSWFKVLDESLDGTDYSNEVYFAVTNGLTDPTGSAADCRQRITLTYDFGASGINSLQRLRRDTGQVEALFVPFVPGAGLQRSLSIDFDGGTADLFKFNDGAPFVGVPSSTPALGYWDPDTTPGNNNTTTGSGLGGGGTWTNSSSNWYDAVSTDAPWTAAANATFTGPSGTVTLAAPQTATRLTFKSDGYLVTGATLTLTSLATIATDATITATIASAIDGSFGLTKTGAGTLVLSNSNTYTGGTIVNAGTLAIASTSSLGPAPSLPTVNLVLNTSSTLRFNGSTSLESTRQIYLFPSTTIDTNSNNATINGVILGSAALTKTGFGTLILTATNTYTGGTVINAGALQIASDSALGPVPSAFSANNITLNGTTLQFGSNLDLNPNRGIALSASGGTLDTQSFTNPSGYGPTNAISGSGNLTKLGPGTFWQTSTVANTLWTGNLIIKEGTWKINGRGGLPINPTTGGLRPAQITLDGGTWQFNANFFASEPNRGITIASGGGTIDTQSFGITWAGPITGSSATSTLTKTGSGLLQLNYTKYAGSYVGNVLVAGGTLQLDGGSALGPLASVTLANSPGVQLAITTASSSQSLGSLSGGGPLGGSVNIASGSSLTVGGNNLSTTFSGNITGVGGAFTKSGSASTLTLLGSNSYTGATTINAGVLAVAPSAAPANRPVIVNGSAEYRLIAAGSYSPSSLTLNGSATAHLLAGRDKALILPAVPTIASAAQLDLEENALIVSYSASDTTHAARDAVRNLLKNGRNAGAAQAAPWNGLGGISSSYATQNGNGFNLALGYADNADLASVRASGSYTIFAGVAVASTTVLVQLTRGADATLDGIVDGQDVAIIGTHFQKPGSGQWCFGDFDYSGTCDGSDVAVLGTTFGKTSPLLSPAEMNAEFGSAFTAAFETGRPAAVPEPTDLTLAGIWAAVFASLYRRRRPGSKKRLFAGFSHSPDRV